MSAGRTITPVPLSGDQRNREAVVLYFSDAFPLSFDHTLSAVEWKKLVAWLDVSGLALYFLDRITSLGQQAHVPPAVLGQLRRRLEQNRRRTKGMIDENIMLQTGFQSGGLSYAVMKGISLCPVSVPNLELRHQFDLDFLIAESDSLAAREILEQRGYVMVAASGRTWEFKKGQTPSVKTTDLYRDLPYRGVELHLEAEVSGVARRLHRVVPRQIKGFTMPVFSPVDLFLAQAMHVAKDISSSFFRGSHLLELYRHVLNRHDDVMFWEQLRQRVDNDRRACLALGMAVALITSVWGGIAPQALTSWTSEQLPPSIQLWLDLYGRAAVLQLPPGNKRYLHLRTEMEIAVGQEPSKIMVLPRGLPPVVVQGAPEEPLQTRVARYRLQLRFLASRARFQLVEGARFVIESRRWRRLRKALP